MKWTESKASTWDEFKYWKARYKKFEIKVSEGGTGFSRNVEYYWFMVNNQETGAKHNSMWSNTKFLELTEAQTAAIEWINNFIKQT